MKKIKHNPTVIPQSLKNINIKAILRSRGIHKKQSQYLELKRAALPLARKLVQTQKLPPPSNVKLEGSIEAPRRHAQFTDEEVISYWEKQIHIVEVLENRFDLKVQQFIKKVVSGFLNHLESEIATNKDFKAKDYFEDNEDDYLVQAQFDFTPLLINQATLAGQEAYKLINVDGVYIPEEIRSKIAENVTKFTQSMLDTDRDTLIKILTNGLEDGKSVPEIRGIIQNEFEDISKNQAQRITRTEVLRASNQGALDAYEQSGVVEGKQWLTAGAVDECAQYEGQIESLDGNFYDGTSEFADGDPPLHPNCRCVLLPVIVGEKGYEPQPNKALGERISELEAQIDKRTKEFKELKLKHADDAAYIKQLEKYLGVDDEKS
jgi:SPP1 gp7 family putative phage head morphogenesis protein